MNKNSAQVSFGAGNDLSEDQWAVSMDKYWSSLSSQGFVSGAYFIIFIFCEIYVYA